MGEAAELRKLVKEFSAEMRNKLLSKSRDGWSGWRDERITPYLKQKLATHFVRAICGDPKQWVDVANFAAFLWWLEERKQPDEEESDD